MSKILNQVIEDYKCLYEWEIRKKEDLQRRLYNQEFLLEEQGAELKELYARIDKAINKIDYIIDYGFDYDGFNDEEDLKKLIDMLVEYAKESKDILQGYDGFMGDDNNAKD